MRANRPGRLTGLLFGIVVLVVGTTPAADVPTPTDSDFTRYGIYEKTAPRPGTVPAVATTLPLKLNADDRIALVGNSLLEQAGDYGFLETMIQQRFPTLRLSVRNLAWSADEVGLRPGRTTSPTSNSTCSTRRPTSSSPRSGSTSRSPARTGSRTFGRSSRPCSRTGRRKRSTARPARESCCCRRPRTRTSPAWPRRPKTTPA